MPILPNPDYLNHPKMREAATQVDATVTAFLASLIYYGILAVTIVLILQVAGLQATSLVAVLGTASLAIGLALQGTLSNLAAGVMLLIFRPFRIGDVIEVAGKSGIVVSLNVFMTEIAAGENVKVLVPTLIQALRTGLEHAGPVQSVLAEEKRHG